MYIGGGYYIITQDSFQRTPYGASMTAAELRAYLKARIGADVSLEYVRTSWLDSCCVIGLVVDGVELIDEDSPRRKNRIRGAGPPRGHGRRPRCHRRAHPHARNRADSAVPSRPAAGAARKITPIKSAKGG